MTDFRALLAALSESKVEFTLSTNAGDIDLLGEIAGIGGYAALRPHTDEIALYGLRCRSIDLPTLIAAKIAAGRPKDLEIVAELRALLEERGCT